jgi:hypothetical protein
MCILSPTGQLYPPSIKDPLNIILPLLRKYHLKPGNILLAFLVSTQFIFYKWTTIWQTESLFAN